LWKQSMIFGQIRGLMMMLLMVMMLLMMILVMGRPNKSHKDKNNRV